MLRLLPSRGCDVCIDAATTPTRHRAKVAHKVTKIYRHCEQKQVQGGIESGKDAGLLQLSHFQLPSQS